MNKMQSRQRGKAFTERRVDLSRAVVFTIEGPGDDWLLLCRGRRSSTSTRKPSRKK